MFFSPSKDNRATHFFLFYTQFRTITIVLLSFKQLLITSFYITLLFYIHIILSYSVFFFKILFLFFTLSLFLYTYPLLWLHIQHSFTTLHAHSNTSVHHPRIPTLTLTRHKFIKRQPRLPSLFYVRFIKSTYFWGKIHVFRIHLFVFKYFLFLSFYFSLMYGSIYICLLVFHCLNIFFVKKTLCITEHFLTLFF